MATPLPGVSTDERRARLVVRHRLAPRGRATSLAEAARDLVGLHATDPRSVYLGAWARVRDATFASIERELYEERSVIRMLGMRRTMFVEPIELAGVVQRACSLDVAARERRRLLARIEASGISSDAERWLARVERETLEALRQRGEATAAELGADVPLLRSRVRLAEGTRFETEQAVSLWVLLGLAAQGRIVRGRPRGSWVSRQYRWSPIDRWLPEGLPDRSLEEARAELARRWLAAFGPGTVSDLRWWTGLTVGVLRKALARIGAVEVRLDDGATGLVLPADLDPTSAPAPTIAFLPALDSTVMGWAERDWYLGGHRAALFDRNGNAGPTIWWGGRVVGGWAQRPDGAIAHRFLEDVGRDAIEQAVALAERLRTWLGDEARIIPTFRTPLERELSS